MTTATAERAPECTPEQAAEWQEQYTEGYRTGRGDVRWGASPRIRLAEMPPEDPWETGAQFVARHYRRAFAIGYTRAYRYETGR